MNLHCLYNIIFLFFINYKTIEFIVLGRKKVKMNGIIALVVILALIIISVIAVEITNNRNAKLKNFFEHPHSFLQI